MPRKQPAGRGFTHRRPPESSCNGGPGPRSTGLATRPMDRRALTARAMSGRSFRFRGARLVQNKKRRPFGENRRTISPRLPRDHPPCGTSLPEGTLFASLCLYHKAPTTATDWTRFALELAGQHADPSGPPVKGCAGTAPALSSPDTAGWVPRGSAATGWHHDDEA
jgi:hypothetical protein